MSKMSSKDKDNKTLHDKLKQFFRINKGDFIDMIFIIYNYIVLLIYFYIRLSLNTIIYKLYEIQNLQIITIIK